MRDNARLTLIVVGFLAALVILMAPFLQLSAIPARAQSDNPGTTDLVACWDLDEDSGTREDEAGNNDLTDNNTVGSAAGKTGNAASFVRANSEYLSIADNPALSMSTGTYTITGWFYLETKPTGGEAYRVIYKTNEINIYITSNNIYHRPNPSGSYIGSINPNATTWYFFAATVDNAGNGALTIDGTKYTGTLNIPSDTANTVYIGWDGSTSYVNGRIDAVMIWKAVLTDDQIAWLRNSGSGRTCNDLIVPTPTPTATNTSTPTATATGAPTGTPTPGAERELTLSSGDTATIKRDFTYGEILNAVMIGVLIVVIVIAVIWATVSKVLS